MKQNKNASRKCPFNIYIDENKDYRVALTSPTLGTVLFRNHEILQESYQHVTRFMSFASVGNKEKQKWMHAFGSKPLKSMKREELVAQPPQTSEFPNKDILAEAFERKEGA
ncbi:hypothetical protein QR680_009301 [Steinernema hermaphroditum]|uniref:Uncharacterized protein n=1 Tax=Steinernema hermaphroditum TaxID=289476 RepID=A0AA39IJU0_9BILA|nr:hypothetical protein QR680_009301 [Steinernema hermaphroditum]